MLGVKKINYLYEDENVKMINPDTERREKLYKLIEDLQVDENTIDNPILILEILKELVITNEPLWDFNRATVEEIRVMLQDVEAYPQTFKNLISEIEELVLDVILDYYKKLNNQLQKKMIELEMITAQANINNVKNKTKEVETIIEKVKLVQIKLKEEEKAGKKKSSKELIKEMFPNLSRKERRAIEREQAKLDKEYLKQHQDIIEEDFGK